MSGPTCVIHSFRYCASGSAFFVNHGQMDPSPPRYDRWPLSVQHAMRLRGALVRCGPGVRGVGWPDTPRVRLAAIANALEGGQFAALLTAAWVWGAVDDPGTPLSVARSAGRSRTSRAVGAQHYELRISPADVVKFGEFGVTTPMRTILDLLHVNPSFGPRERSACRELLRISPVGAEDMSARLLALRRPHVRLARERFRGVLAERTATLP